MTPNASNDSAWQCRVMILHAVDGLQRLQAERTDLLAQQATPMAPSGQRVERLDLARLGGEHRRAVGDDAGLRLLSGRQRCRPTHLAHCVDRHGPGVWRGTRRAPRCRYRAPRWRRSGRPRTQGRGRAGGWRRRRGRVRRSRGRRARAACRRRRGGARTPGRRRASPSRRRRGGWCGACHRREA